MKKLLTILILLLAVASQGWADGESTSLIGGFSVWSGGDTYTQVESSSSYKFTTKQNWGGMGYWISSENPSGKRLVVKTEEDADLNITVGYTNGISFERRLSSKDRYIKLNDQYSIQNVNIQYAVDASSTEGGLSVIFTDISIDNSSEDSPVEVVKLNLLNAMTPDDNTAYTESGSARKMETSASWAGISISNNLQASTIYVKATDADNKDSKLKIAAYYSDGWSTEYFDQVVSGGKTLKFDETRTITYLQIQNQENAKNEDKKSITFSDIYIDTPTETPTYAESFQIRINISSMASEEIATYNSNNGKLTIIASKTASLDLSGITSLRQGKNLVVNFESAAKANITVTYSDASSYVYNAGESGVTSRTLKLEDKEISKIEIENAETSESAVVTSLNLNEADNSSSEEGSTSVDYGTELTPTSTLPVATENYANYAQYDKALFSDAKVGDIITVSISGVGEESQIALQSDWKNLNAAAGADLTAGATSWQYTLTASGINQLKDNGLSVTGKNITINKVYMKSVGSVNPDISEVALANFDDINMESKEGKQLYAGSSSNISAQNKKLVVTPSAAAKLKVAVYLVDVDNPITEEVTADGTAKSEYSVPLGSEDKKIKKILITNNGTDAVTYSSISLEDYVDPNLIWSGSQELTSTALAIAAGKFSGIESGNRIRLTIGSTSGSDNTMKVTYAQDANMYETFNDNVEASKTYDFEITGTNIEAIKANGISITGSNATLTKIERITDGYSEGTPSLDDLPAGWDAEYNSTDKVITFSGGWQAKGWNIGTATYNEKKDFVVTFAEKPVKTGTTEDAVNVMLYVDYVNRYGKTETLSNSTSTDLSVSIPLKENEQITNGIVRIINILIKTDVATTLKLSSVAFNEYVPRTSKDLSTGSQKIRAHSSVAIAKGMFEYAAVGDVLTINVPEIAEGAKYTLKGWNQDTRSEGNKNWSSFLYEQELATNATSITCTLNADILNIIQNAGLSIEGNGFTCGNVTLSTAGEVGTAQTHTNPTFNLTINEAIGGSVKVKKDNTETDERTFALETEVTLEPVANTGFTFSKWMKGDTEQTAGENNSLTLSITDNVSVTALFNAQALADNSSLTIWQGEKEASWGELLQLTSSVTNILERFETIRITASPMESVTNPDAYFKVFFNTIGSDSKIVDWESAKITGANQVVEYNLPTTTIVDQLKGGFGIFGQNVKITEVELYKPTPITALAEEDAKTLWSNTSGEALAEWNTITIDRNSEWGAILEEDERIIISVKAKDANCEWPTVALSNSDGSIGSTANLLNDLTMPTELTITLTAEMVNKMKNGFSITGDGATITKAVLYKPTMPTKTVHTLNSTETAISGEANVTVAAEKFANISAYDVLTVNFTITTSPANVILKGNGEDGGWDYLKEMKFENGETLFALPLTPAMTSNLKKNGLQITGSGYTFKSVTIKTAGEVPSDEEKKDDEKKGDEEAIIDEKTGEADLNELSAQDDTKTTLTQNEDGSITMTTTEAYQAAQIWFNNPEEVAGNVLKVQLAESSVNVTVTVKYTDGTQSQMSANTMAAKARGAVRAATRADSGTEIEVPLETGKEVQNIEVKNNVAGTITIQKMQVTTINVFTNGVANLSMLKPQSNATYDTSTHTLATTKGWTGATISPVDGEKVSGKELLIEFAVAAKVKVAVKYRTDVEGPSIIMEKAAANVRLALDNTKNIQEISIQPTDAAIVTFTKIAVNGEESDDGKLKPGKSITLWENSAGEKLAWNEVAKQGEDIGEMLQEYDELLITISGVAENCDWPKVFLRDANSEQAGNEVLLNDVASFPYTVRIVLTGDMAEQLANGFCVCGDGITVTKLVAYRPEEPKEGDIHLADLNYGYNSSYDKGTHTITTTSRWAARGWEIGDKRYNDKNLIIVKFEPVDFPVTLKMEYTTGVQTAQATSVGVPAGRTELMLEIPQGISKLNRVYLIYEEPGSLRLTEASVVYQDKLKLSTAIQSFEAEGVIRDGRYDTDGWYNLRGMRIQEPKTSGVYIHGGKKVVIY